MSGVEVNLACADNVPRTTTTDANGHYQFTNVRGDQSCTVAVTEPDGCVLASNSPSPNPTTIANLCADQTVDFIDSPQPAAACVGDCRGDNQVTVDEIVLMVNIALGNADISLCESGDTNQDGDINVDEILAAVNAALTGCEET